jgi:hypothetical protein
LKAQADVQFAGGIASQRKGTSRHVEHPAGVVNEGAHSKRLIIMAGSVGHEPAISNGGVFVAASITAHCIITKRIVEAAGGVLKER